MLHVGCIRLHAACWLHSLGDDGQLLVQVSQAPEHHPLAVVPGGVGLGVIKQAGLVVGSGDWGAGIGE